MSLKTLIFAGVSAFAISFVLPAHAQESEPEQPVGNANTTQSDKEEEDWRNSRRKSDPGDFDPISNPVDTGIGDILITTDPIDRLPPESRRHLKRERAKVIAGMGTDGDVQDAAYEPSDDAQDDPRLAAQEKAVWEEMMQELGSGSGSDAATDPSDNGGQGQAQAQSGQGQGQGQQGQGSGSEGTGQQAGTTGSTQAMRGGSATSASDILNRMRGQSPATGQTGSASGQSNGQGQSSGQGQTGSQAGQTGSAQAGTATGSSSSGGQTGQAQTAGGTGQSDGQAGAASASTGAQTGSASAARGGSATSASDILGQMRGQQGATGTTGNTSNSGAAGGSVLSRPNTTGPSQSSGASASSASDYLRTTTGTEQTPDRDN